jgi:hypothetical protein
MHWYAASPQILMRQRAPGSSETSAPSQAEPDENDEHHMPLLPNVGEKLKEVDPPSAGVVLARRHQDPRIRDVLPPKDKPTNKGGIDRFFSIHCRDAATTS